MKKFLSVLGMLAIFAMVFSCRDVNDQQSPANTIVGTWQMQNSGTSVVIYSFTNDGKLTITEQGTQTNTNTSTYSVVRQNYDNPQSTTNLQDIVYLLNTKYILSFSDASHMSFTTSKANGPRYDFVRQK